MFSKPDFSVFTNYMIISLRGLPGAGKSTIGKLLAGKLGCPFYEMDDYIPTDLKEKIKAGNLLTETEVTLFFSDFIAVLRQRSAKGNLVVSGCFSKKTCCKP